MSKTNGSKPDWNLWGHLRERYEHAQPRKMLALDGGGLRGIISLEILGRLEQILSSYFGSGSNFRLCQFFDYIAGTSTGAVIAAGLARGMSVRELTSLYESMAHQIFAKSKLTSHFRHRYESVSLEQLLRREFSDPSGNEETLEPRHLKCMLMVVLKNMSTDSPWPISSNPFAKYNDPLRADSNLLLPLWKIVRASTAAPIFFPPEVFTWSAGHSFVFADGGITPYNNPAFQLFKMATLPEYRLNWSTGTDKLLLVSIGTGKTPNIIPFKPSSTELPIWKNVPQTIFSLMNTIKDEQDINCRAIGHCVHGPTIDSELECMFRKEGAERQFRYVRYDADLSVRELMQKGFSDRKIRDIRSMDSVKAIADLKRIGQETADQVIIQHLGNFVSSNH